MAIKAILFDKDGTLIDVNGTWVPFYKELLTREQGLSPVQVDAKMERAGLDLATQTFRGGSILAGGTTRQLVELWWDASSPAELDAMTKRFDRDYVPLALQHLRPLMPLKPILQGLRDKGFLLGVATNDGEMSARGHMAALGVAELFETIIGADSVAVAKPSGQMVKFFANTVGLHPSEIAMVGDNIHDLEEAHNGGAGMSIAVLTGNGKREDLAQHADHVLGSVADIAALLDAGRDWHKL
jgi:phosphoglycolate phosphatase